MTATSAREALDGQCIYAHACQLAVEFSRLDKLDISSNDPTHHDYTITPHHAFSGVGGGVSSIPVAGAAAGIHQPMTMSAMHHAPGNAPVPPGNPPLGMQLFGSNPFGVDPFRTAVVDPFGTPFPSSVQQQQHLGGFGTVGVPPPDVSVTPGRVILANNLANELSPDALATLIGVYADVIRVKILFKKPDSALVQLRDAAHTDRVSFARFSSRRALICPHATVLIGSTFLLLRCRPPASRLVLYRLRTRLGCSCLSMLMVSCGMIGPSVSQRRGAAREASQADAVKAHGSVAPTPDGGGWLARPAEPRLLQ